MVLFFLKGGQFKARNGQTKEGWGGGQTKEGWGGGRGLGHVVVVKKRSLICKPLNLCVSEVPPWSRVKGSSIFLSFCFSPASVL